LFSTLQFMVCLGAWFVYDAAPNVATSLNFLVVIFFTGLVHTLSC